MSSFITGVVVGLYYQQRIKLKVNEQEILFYRRIITPIRMMNQYEIMVSNTMDAILSDDSEPETIIVVFKQEYRFLRIVLNEMIKSDEYWSGILEVGGVEV